MRRALGWLLVFALAVPSAPGLAQEPVPVEAAVAAGVRQVEEGDFEGAVTTLTGAIARLRGDPGRVRLLVQADIQLAVAHVALDHTAEAVRAFAEALALQPDLKLDPDRFSPKLLRALETAREQEARRTAAAPARSSRRTAIIVGAAAVAAGAGALALRGGGPGLPTFTGARFGTPVLVCPDGSDNLDLPFAIQVEARSAERLSIRSATAVVTIENATQTGEIGFASNRPTTVMPQEVSGDARVTLFIQSSLLCGNGRGDPGRFNEWSGRVTLETSAGIFMFDVADRMRVNIP